MMTVAAGLFGSRWMPRSYEIIKVYVDPHLAQARRGYLFVLGVVTCRKWKSRFTMTILVGGSLHLRSGAQPHGLVALGGVL